MNSRWQHIAMVATVVLLSVVIAMEEHWPLLGYAALGVMVIAWFTFGRLGSEGDTRAVAFMVVLVFVGAAVTASAPSAAIYQCLAYPLIWMSASGIRQSIIASAALAAAVGVGFGLSVGSEPDGLLQATLIPVLSLAFSIVMGLWITRISLLSEERQRLVDELRETQNELAAVHRDAGRTTERERLAREIHDTIAQDLTGLVLLAQRARRDLAAGSADIDAHLDVLEQNARSTLAETRALVAASASVEPVTGGLGDALERLAERFTRETAVHVTVDAPDLPALDRDLEVVLLRSAQESLANIRKHAAASTATVSLRVANGEAVLTVTDDGRGFDPDAPSTGFGLEGLRQRLALVAGRVDVASSPGGTTLIARLPLTGAPLRSNA